nr:hypothetical protein [uncultured Dyadobacter sp.]
MKNTILSLIIIAGGLLSCTESRRLTPAPETIFDEQGLHVITSFYNERTSTISLLYGNDEAVVHAGKPEAEHMPGEVFKLVTWGLKGNPLWFGGNINGPLQSIETVQVTSAGSERTQVTHAVQRQDGKTVENSKTDRAERISFIFAQRASVFP